MISLLVIMCYELSNQSAQGVLAEELLSAKTRLASEISRITVRLLRGAMRVQAAIKGNRCVADLCF